MSATHSRSGDDDTVVLWDANAVRLRRVELGAALQTLLDPLGRPLTVSGGDGLPAVRALCWLEPQADLAALRNLRRDTIAQEYSWVVDLLCKPGAPPGRREACAAAKAQWRSYELEQAAAGGGWAARAPVIEVRLPAPPHQPH